MDDSVPGWQDLDRELRERADAARKNAFAPFSNFQVGAAVRTRSGQVHAACNVENVSYPLGTCAERNAIAAAVAAEGPDVTVTDLVLLATNAGVPSDCTPCGACRQALIQFAPGGRVHHRRGGEFHCDSTESLLPHAFRFEFSGSSPRE